MKNSVNTSGLGNKCLFKIDLVDGTSQWIQIPEYQAYGLGLQVQANAKSLEKVPIVIPTVETELESTHDVDVSDKLQDDKTSHFVYKIVKPEDLNLKPVIKTHLPRGRPRKRPNQKINCDNTKQVEEPPQFIKQVRTRSGRITKPPKHIEKDFKKIDISDDGRNESELKISEFEPLTTNETPTEEPLQFLEQHSKKRNIPSRFRCPTCNKAYLGKIKMMSHFQKHPDHGPLPKYCKLKHDSTWNFLVLTSQKYKGPKGEKFCQELDVLLQNVRILAQYLFKPVVNEGESYFINESLAHIFGISAGNYNIDESELNRDVTLYEYLENTGTNSNEQVIVNTNVISNSKIKNVIDKPPSYNNLDIKKSCENVENSMQNNLQNPFNSFEYMINNHESGTVTDYTGGNKKDYGSDNITNIEKDTINLNGINLTLNSQSHHPSIAFSISDTSHNLIMNKEQIKNNCTSAFISTENSDTSSTTPNNCLAVVKYEMQPKHSFPFSNRGYDNISSDIDHEMESNQLNNISAYNNLEIKQKSVFNIDTHKNKSNTSEHMSEKPNNSHITLQNELHDVDELILDTGQVSNILDNSSNSDDIMNVDQFVNERFKKLTEPDIDIQNNLLNLELPPLDMFNFHTS